MDINVQKLPKNGGYYAFQATVWHEGELQFTLTKKLSITEFSIALKRNCVTDLNDALNKLKNFTLSEANAMFTAQQYEQGKRYVGDFSPCW